MAVQSISSIPQVISGETVIDHVFPGGITPDLEALSGAFSHPVDNLDAAGIMKTLDAWNQSLRQLIAIEYRQGSVDIGRRDEIFECFKSLHAKAKLLEHQGCEGNTTFNLFARNGVGAESFRVYSKLPFPDINSEHPSYPSYAMVWALGKLHLRRGDRIPGSDQNILEEPKIDIRIEGGGFVEGRVNLHEQVISGYKEKNIQQSEALSKIELYSPYTSQKTFSFFRGGLGFGKSTRFKQMTGLDEVSADVIKVDLGHLTLCHHEACALSGTIRKRLEMINHAVSMQTNVRRRDTEFICKEDSSVVKIVYDIAVALDVAKSRVEKRARDGGLSPAPKDVEDLHRQSEENRSEIIAAALKGVVRHYILYDNNGDQLRSVLEINDRKITHVNLELLPEKIKPIISHESP